MELEEVRQHMSMQSFHLAPSQSLLQTKLAELPMNLDLLNHYRVQDCHQEDYWNLMLVVAIGLFRRKWLDIGCKGDGGFRIISCGC